MVQELLDEYVACATQCMSVDYGDKKSVRRYNKASDRMRAITDEVVAMGHDAVGRLATLLEVEPASGWVAHHLVEKADLDPETTRKCFAKVEEMIAEAEAEANLPDAMGEKMWLQEWRTKKGLG
ncbi:MAG: hypothetical protein JXB13_05590 [Phycisphaerae bacterium]|nr:hypothetical protein [Phycisphaerae bacterium]